MRVCVCMRRRKLGHMMIILHDKKAVTKQIKLYIIYLTQLTILYEYNKKKQLYKYMYIYFHLMFKFLRLFDQRRQSHHLPKIKNKTKIMHFNMFLYNT